jgi:hypothetical protein
VSIITPEVTLSYPKLLKPSLGPKPKPGDKSMFSVMLLFTHEAIKSPEFQAIKDAAVAKAREAWGSKADELIRTGQRKMPFRKDVEAMGHDPKTFACFMNVRAGEDYPPQVVTRSGKVITDPREIYPGVRARVSLSVFSYDTNGNRGVSFGLNNVQKLGDGPRIDGRRSAADEFPVLPDEPAADMPAEGGTSDNLADLLV